MRQLLVSNLTAPAFTNGALAAGAVCAVGKTASGFTILGTPGMVDYSDSRQIQFVQGTASGNIFSPWIDGKDIISWAGRNYAAQTAQVSRLTFANAATVAGTMTVKFTEVNNGVEQFRRKSVTINVTAGQTANNIALAVMEALTGIAAANIVAATSYPVVGTDWATVAMPAIPGAIIDVTGSVFSLSPATNLASFSTQSENLDGSNGTTLTIAATAVPSIGSGDADVLSDFELSLQGNLSFYNRVRQPNTPPTYINLAANYDLYSISWLNPVVGQIKGVDNHRNLTVAMVDGLGVNAVQTAFELALNNYLASVPGSFAAVNI
jgi:hypothetical protein